MTDREPITVLLTGAAGQIGYALLPMLCRGQAFGEDQPLNLHLLEIPPGKTVLEGVVMELNDCNFPLVRKIVATTDVQEAFTGVDVAIFVGAFPRREGMLRKDLLERNAGIFQSQGEALEKYAKRDVKALVVGNPANTNCLTLARNAPSVPRQNFAALTRLDQNRASGFLARRAGVLPSAVERVIVWGNHSATQYPDVSHATINGKSVHETIDDSEWLQGDFIRGVQKRGAAVIAKRGLSSAVSAANAITECLRLWIGGTPASSWLSLGVMSDGNSYGVPDGIVYSFPVTTKPGGEYTIVSGLEIDEFSRERLDATAKELLDERDAASTFFPSA